MTVTHFEKAPESPAEQPASTLISPIFMLLFGLSMPAVFGGRSAHNA